MKKAEVIVYATHTCPYCTNAVEFLEREGFAPVKVYLEGRSELMQEIREMTGQRTVPQIFVNGHHIGGFSDLQAKFASGEFQKVLEKEPVALALER